MLVLWSPSFEDHTIISTLLRWFCSTFKKWVIIMLDFMLNKLEGVNECQNYNIIYLIFYFETWKIPIYEKFVNKGYAKKVICKLHAGLDNLLIALRTQIYIIFNLRIYWQIHKLTPIFLLLFGIYLHQQNNISIHWHWNYCREQTVRVNIILSLLIQLCVRYKHKRENVAN